MARSAAGPVMSSAICPLLILCDVSWPKNFLEGSTFRDEL